MNKSELENLYRQLIEATGENPEREGLSDTPRRAANTFEDLFGGYNKDPKDVLTLFDGEEYDEMIICKDIDFYSTCEHHLQPFFGKVHIGYIPADKIVGISKLPRMVEIFSRRLQNQERLTKQIAETIDELVKPKGVGVIIEARHLCMQSRGVEKHNTSMTTSSFTKLFKKDPRTRNEFLTLTK